jgi:hypothetical protein
MAHRSPRNCSLSEDRTLLGCLVLFLAKQFGPYPFGIAPAHFGDNLVVVSFGTLLFRLGHSIVDMGALSGSTLVWNNHSLGTFRSSLV